MAANVGEAVGVFAGTPVLKVRLAVVPLLHQARRSQLEFAQPPFPVELPSPERPVVESLVIFNADKQPALPRFALNFQRFPRGHYQRLHADHMLIVPKRLHRGRKV